MKTLITFLSVLFICGTAYSQHQDCYEGIDPIDLPEGNHKSYHGAAHTMQGELKILIIFCGFENDTNTIDNWALGQLPDWADDVFEADVANIGNNDNLSKYYYNLSQFSSNPFKVTADVFPEFIEINNPVWNNSMVDDYINSNYTDFDWRWTGGGAPYFYYLSCIAAGQSILYSISDNSPVSQFSVNCTIGEKPASCRSV